MKYLVAGGAGFIGSNIVKKLLENNETVRAVDNFSTGRKENIEEFLNNPNFELFQGDLSDFGVAEMVVKDMDFVLHQAALPSVPRSIDDPISSNNSNVTATLNLLVASRRQKIKKFVFASSSSIYGDNPELPQKEDFPIRPISPYALTKYVGERYCQIFWNIYGLPTICLRYFNVFGPKHDPTSQYSAVIPKFITALLKNQSPVILGDGEQTRDFTFVDNVVEANLLAAKAIEGNGEVVNIACGGRISLNELVKTLQEITGSAAQPEYKNPRPGDVKDSLADIGKAQKILGYEPKITIKEGLEKTVEWLRQNPT